MWHLYIHLFFWITDRVSSHEPSQNSLTFPWHFPDHFVVFPDHETYSVFDFSAGPSARGRQLYCRACNFKNMSALLASKFYTSYAEPNGLQLFMDTGTTRFYSKARHLVMIKTNTRQRCVPSKLEISKLYQLVPWGKYEFRHTHSDDPFLHLSGLTWWITWMFPQTWLQ